ncbi:hypothetical protein F889_00660 [Acinetobacter colistiniresistens]|uniref:Lipoprotein n=1 Tax=Acinetobacter colistiniresistens TaxID=280145 RepID=N9R0W6_9GAMM|nr:hypothetical protein [Acinetobacter colistiniresistens]ENX35961.1 hypothetical protein F889_00660 [Acinetobacter colistiniresistens]
MNKKIIFPLFFILAACNVKGEVCFSDSKRLVLNLYKTFPTDGNIIVEKSDKNLISKFFSNELTNLLVNDYECREKTAGVCKIDFNILNNSQDDLGSFKILQATNNVVTVKFNTPTHGEFIDFYMESKDGCKFIKDIKYNDSNLLNVLRN